MRLIFSAFVIATGFYLAFGNSSRHLAIRRILFLSFILVGLSILLFADFWTRVSRYLGVGSSTQLLTYLLTFAFITSTISNFRWKREQERKTVEIARQIALNTEN
jgi:hypothetical protein